MDNKDRDFLSSFDGFFESFSLFRSSFNRSIFDGSEFPKDDDKNFHKSEEVIETANHSIKKEKWVSIDGCQVFERNTKTSKSPGQLKPSKKDLEAQLQEAISSQDFEKACDLRDQIKKFKV